MFNQLVESYKKSKASQKPTKEKTNILATGATAPPVEFGKKSQSSGEISVVTLDDAIHSSSGPPSDTAESSKSSTKRSASKQEELRKDCNLENDILVGLYKKGELGLLTVIETSRAHIWRKEIE